MTTRMSDSVRKARFAEAQELARSRATQWRIFLRDKEGEPLAAWIVIDAGDEETALNRACDYLDCRRSHVSAPTRALPLLRSDEWQGIYKEVGLA